MTVQVPCGRTTGHGESCSEGYLCEQCAEIKQLRTENIDRLLQKGKLEDEIQRLLSSPTNAEIDELIEGLQGIIGTEPITQNAAEALHRLARNQITASHTAIAQVAALQAQEADACKREADAQQQRAESLEYKCEQLAKALVSAMGLVDELLRENGRLCAASNEPPSMRLFAAKNSFDATMKRLLGDQPPEPPSPT